MLALFTKKHLDHRIAFYAQTDPPSFCYSDATLARSTGRQPDWHGVDGFLIYTLAGV